MQGDRQCEIVRMHENFIVESSTTHVILHYSMLQSILTQKVGGWAYSLSSCIRDQSNENYPPYVSICLIWNSISLLCYEEQKFKTSKEDDERSITIQFLNGWAKPNILYIPLITLKFTYNRCNKVVECTLNKSITITALKMVFLIHGDIVLSDAALYGFP